MTLAGCILGMCGKNCVAIAADNRFISVPYSVPLCAKKIFRIGPRLYLGMTGLATDVMTVHCRMMYRKNIFEIDEEREIAPQNFKHLMSHMLYEHRHAPFYVESVIVGLDAVYMEPFICSMDVLGGSSVVDDFVVAGSATQQLYGMCEALYNPDMDPDTLFEVVAHCMLRAISRDALSGWGARVLIIEKNRMIERTLITQPDD